MQSMHQQRPFYAFNPDPLPPTVDLDAGLLLDLEESSRRLGELSGVSSLRHVNPVLLVNLFVRREAVLSSKIEGTIATVSDLYAFEARQMELFPDADSNQRDDSAVREVWNYVQALNYGIAQVVAQGRPISLQLIREMHQLLVLGTRGQRKRPGEFRDEPVCIGPENSTVHNARYVPPLPTVMRPAMKELEDYIRSGGKYPKLIELALIHYQFEAIHPFLDGNGRIGRLLIALILARWGLLAEPLLYISGYFEQRRPEYYERLQAVSERGEWSEWIKFFLEGVASEARDTRERIDRLVRLQEDTKQALQTTTRSNVGLIAVDLAFESPFLNSSILVRYASVREIKFTDQTARNHLRALEEVGFLDPITPPFPSRLNWFIARPVLETIG